MASEISYAALANAGRVAAVLSALLHENLYDPSSLRGLIEFTPYQGGGSATQNVTTITRGSAMAARSSEISGGLSNTLPTSSQFQLTVAGYGLLFKPTDLFRITQPGAPLDVPYLIGMLIESLELTLTNLITALFANISGGVGTTTVDLTTDDIYDAIFTLNLVLNNAALLAVLHPQQINDLIESIRGETGAQINRMDTQNALAIGVGKDANTGKAFDWAGVSFHQSDSVATANGGADRQGGMFTRGFAAYTLADVANMDPMINPADVLFATNEMWIERSRDAANGMTALYANAFPGVAEAEDARCVKITTDA